ncbi:MAG: FAD-binding protein, partial [Acidobacteria bacterium]|nr:FAD-binding protein [Acidobacteriota bacterium]
MVKPNTPEELAEALGGAGSAGRTVIIEGHASKRLMGGPVEPSDLTISTAGLNRILQYNPGDLTISVEAGISFRELSRMLAGHRQMIPLDPPFSETATVGGIMAANTCGPRRRLYGAARDMVIGMKFATLEGKLIQTGGMVVKNVAGLDIGKLMIGSFGTLAALAVVNFKVVPMPARQRTFLLSFDSAGEAIAARETILKSALQPEALDLLNPPAAATLGNSGYLLALQAAGNEAAIGRYQRELSGIGRSTGLEGAGEAALWRDIRECTPDFLAAYPEGAVARASCTLKDVAQVLESVDGPALARAQIETTVPHALGGRLMRK